MPNDKTKIITARVETYKNGVQVGSVSAPVNVKLLTTSENSRPVFNSYRADDTNEVTAAMEGGASELKFIQNKSFVRITASSATARNGASIVKYRAEIGEKVVESNSSVFDFGSIETSGVQTLKIFVYDSRGYNTGITAHVPVYEFSDISVDLYDVRRENGVGTNIKIDFAGSLFPLVIGGEEKNDLQIVRYRYKEATASSYGAYSTISDVLCSGGEFVYENDNFLNLQDDTAYYLQFEVSDALSTRTVTVYIPKGKPLVSLRSERVGINTNTPQSALDVDGNIRQNGYFVQGFISVLSPGTDLDTLLQGGIYIASGGGSSADNYPTSASGFIEVISSPYADMQRFTASDGTMYVRAKVQSATWGQWLCLTFT